MFTHLSKWTMILVLFLWCDKTVMAGGCSVATIKGSIAFAEQGTAIVSPMRAVPYVSSGIATFDGAGNFSGEVTANIGGMIVKDTFTGTYTVGTDCTFINDFKGSQGDIHQQVGTITGEGMFQEAHYIYTDANLVVSGTARKPSSGK